MLIDRWRRRLRSQIAEYHIGRRPDSPDGAGGSGARPRLLRRLHRLSLLQPPGALLIRMEGDRTARSSGWNSGLPAEQRTPTGSLRTALASWQGTIQGYQDAWSRGFPASSLRMAGGGLRRLLDGSLLFPSASWSAPLGRRTLDEVPLADLSSGQCGYAFGSYFSRRPAPTRTSQ